MKLEVGQFARLKSGYIVKVLNLKDNWIETDTKFITRTFPKDFVKASYNIIDILEVGDYVNGVEITEIYEKGDSFRGNRNYIFKEKTIEVANDNYETIPVEALFINNEIETIVTHEQMEQMEYKVEE